MSERSRRRDRVLLVAPQNEDTMLLAGLLTTAGYSLSTVFDADTALELCSTSIPDHAIIDLATPALDGVDLATRLRALEERERSRRAMRIVAVAASPGAATHPAFDVELAAPATVTRLIDALGARRAD